MTQRWDIHQHIVYGVDDGPSTLEGSIRMLEAARRAGVERIIATSHAMPSIKRFPVERYYRHLQEINQISLQQQMGVAVYEGCEVFASDIAVRLLEDGQLPTLAGSRFVLVEFDPLGSLEDIARTLRQIGNLGLIPVVAHCERYAALVKEPQNTVQLRRHYQVRLQVNAATMTRRQPRPVRRFLEALIEADALDYVASDAHNTSSRPMNLDAAWQAVAKKLGQGAADGLLGGNQGEIFGDG